MWKEETPVSRLIDYVGRQNVTVNYNYYFYYDITKRAFMSSFYF